MTIGRLLESFDGTKSSLPSIAAEALDPEQIRAAAFEAGYSSGWEDAKEAEAKARQRVEAEFERNIQALAFTYHEAVDRVRGELAVFLEELVDVLIPSIVPELVREHLRAELLGLSDPLLELPVEIVASPDCRDWVAAMLTNDLSFEVQLVEDDTLGAHQVFLRTSKREVEVNMLPLISKLKSQLSAMSVGTGAPSVETDAREQNEEMLNYG